MLTLHRPLHEANIPAGATVEVVSVARGAIRVRDTYGHEADVAPRRHATSWTASSPRVIELARGDRILIRQNHCVAGLINGDVLTVTAREPSGVWRTFDADGCEKTIPNDFRALVHGYAVTSHKAQGRTCDEVIVCAARLDAKATYVAFSRARQQATRLHPGQGGVVRRTPYYQSTAPSRARCLDACAQLSIRLVYQHGLDALTHSSRAAFLIGSFLIVTGTSAVAGWLLTRFCPDAAGSGIPQLKPAFWKDLGFVPWRVVWVMFLGGVGSVGGGSSLGREGPSVQLAVGLASQLSGLLGTAKNERRTAAAAGAAAGLAAAFNTPLAPLPSC